MRRLLALALLIAPLVLSAAPVLAQCAMCQTALLNSPEGRGMGQEFNRAILVMFFAPYAVFGVVGTILLRHRIGESMRRERGRLHRTWRRVARPRVH
jgi:hypothetical protein